VDLILKGREVRITDHLRRAVDQRLGRVVRLDSRVRSMQVEVIGDLNPRTGGRYRVEVSCQTGRHVLRAHGVGNEVGAAIDEVAARLERQLVETRDRQRTRATSGARRLHSSPPGPAEEPPPTG
jgi:ribosomal subunit interface protein